MKPSEVPEELIDLAMTGAKPGCRGDAAFYLANVLPAIAAELPAHERQVREQVAAEIKALRDGVANPDKPYNEAFVHALDCAIREITKEAP